MSADPNALSNEAPAIVCIDDDEFIQAAFSNPGATCQLMVGAGLCETLIESNIEDRCCQSCGHRRVQDSCDDDALANLQTCETDSPPDVCDLDCVCTNSCFQGVMSCPATFDPDASQAELRRMQALGRACDDPSLRECGNELLRMFGDDPEEAFVTALQPGGV